MMDEQSYDSTVLRSLNQPRTGIGACIKRCVKYARESGYDMLVVMAGNDKDDPVEIPRLVKPIMDDVQVNRLLPGGSSPHFQLFRRVSIKLLSFFSRVYPFRWCTDLTNGFRTYRLSLFNDPWINTCQDRLDAYEYE